MNHKTHLQLCFAVENVVAAGSAMGLRVVTEMERVQARMASLPRAVWAVTWMDVPLGQFLRIEWTPTHRQVYGRVGYILRMRKPFRNKRPPAGLRPYHW